MATYSKSPVKLGVGKSTRRYSPHTPRDYTGPELAEHVFGVHDLEACEPDDCGEDFYAEGDLLTQEPFQLSLDLQPIQDYEEGLRRSIRRYDAAYRKMAMSALRWYQLMEDVETFPHIKEQFENLQMMRKLSGSEYE